MCFPSIPQGNIIHDKKSLIPNIHINSRTLETSENLLTGNLPGSENPLPVEDVELAGPGGAVGGRGSVWRPGGVRGWPAEVRGGPGGVAKGGWTLLVGDV